MQAKITFNVLIERLHFANYRHESGLMTTTMSEHAILLCQVRLANRLTWSCGHSS